jgi:hypothetical protein
MYSSSRFSVIAALALLSLTGCEAVGYIPSEQAPEQSTSSSPEFIELSPTQPPALQQEEVPVITDPYKYIWRPGHWHYESRNFNWIPGELMVRPDPTAVWAPDHWEHRTYGWVFVHGYWQ